MRSLGDEVTVVDGKNHLMGRLASVVAKELLKGRKVAVLRCEELNMSGPLFRSKVKFMWYLRKRCLVNPARGPFHHRRPSMMFRKTVRGMLPHKTPRGTRALKRLQTFEGTPSKYKRAPRYIVPDAQRTRRLKPGRKFTIIGRLAQDVGWHYRPLVQKMEEKRIAAANAERVEYKKRVRRLEKNMAGCEELKELAEKLEAFGYPSKAAEMLV